MSLTPGVCAQSARRIPAITGAVIVVLLLSACRTTGDFGRREPSFLHDTVVPATREIITGATGLAHSNYELTHDEERLRAYSETLFSSEAWSLERAADEAGANLGLDERDYQRERRVEHASGAAALDPDRDVRRPELILASIDFDLDVIASFEGAAIRVYEADMDRLAALRENGDVPARDVVNTTDRAKENRGIVEETILTLHNRIDDYEIETRRTVLRHPEASQIALHNAIGRLAARVDKLETRIRAVSDPEGVPHNLDLAG